MHSGSGPYGAGQGGYAPQPPPGPPIPPPPPASPGPVYGGPPTPPAPGHAPFPGPPGGAYAPGPPVGATGPGRPRSAAGPLRGVVAFVCLFFAVVLTIPALATRWLHEELISTEGFTGNATQLIDEPSIRKEVASLIGDEVAARLPAQVAQTQNVRQLVDAAVTDVMRRDDFREVWEQGVAAAHGVVVNTLLGKDSAVTQIEGNELLVRLDMPLDPLQTELAKRGIRVDLQALPTVVGVNLADIPTSGAAQDAARTADDAATWLPLLTLALLVAGLAVAVNRLRALLITAIGTLIMSALLLAMVALARAPLEKEASTQATLSKDATGAIFEVFTDSLTTMSWIVLGVSAAAVVGAVAGQVVAGRRR